MLTLLTETNPFLSLFLFGFALSYTIVFFHYYRVFEHRYLKSWGYGFGFVTLSSLLGVGFSVFNVDSSSELILQLGIFISILCSYLFPFWVFVGLRASLVEQPPPVVKIHILLFVTLLIGICTSVPFAFSPTEQELRDLLRISVRFIFFGIGFLYASFWIVVTGQKVFALRSLSALLFGWGFLNVTIALITGLNCFKAVDWSSLFVDYPAFITTVFDFYRHAELFVIGLLGVSLLNLLQEDTRKTTQQATQQIEYLDTHDMLTGAGNREWLISKLNQDLSEGAAERIVLVAMLGLDRFKLVNDNFGIKQGDEVLLEVVNRLEGSVLKPTYIARTGGDLFTIVLHDVATKQQQELAASHMLKLIEKPFVLKDHSVKLTASVGFANFPEHGDCAESVLQKANIAFHLAKREQNVFQPYALGMEEESNRMLAAGKALRAAIERDEFIFYFQPQLNIKTRTVEGFEALVRWKHPEKGILPPGAFLEDIEHLQMSKVLDEFLLEKAVVTLSEWCKRFPRYNIPVAVNLSPNQFQSLDLVSRIRDLLTEHNVPGEVLELEITENVAMEDIEKGMDTIRLLQEMGVKVSIDDFGTGYSSLAYLRKIPIDKIKIDRSFISEMQVNDSDYTIVHSMIKLAHGLGKRVLAEGVEINEQLALLERMGCDSIQGYFFYKPLPEEEAISLLVKSM